MNLMKSTLVKRIDFDEESMALVEHTVSYLSAAMGKFVLEGWDQSINEGLQWNLRYKLGLTIA